MTQPVLNLTESAEFTVLRSFLLAILPLNIPVIRGQDNRVPEPQVSDFVTLTPIGRERIALNTVVTTDNYPANPGTRTDNQPTQATIQIDVHGPNSADNTQIITTLFQSDYAFDYFASQSADVAPLYLSDPRQLPYLNGEQQIETRWSIDAVIECNPTVTTQQDFAAALSIKTIDVVTTYPL